MPKLVLDSNMILVFVIGSISPTLLGVAKRVKEYRPSDYDLLKTCLSFFDEIILLPNTISEASNLIDHLKGDRRQDCMEFLASLTAAGERYVPSSLAAKRSEYMALGITDAAILCTLEPGTCLLTADEDLFVAATCREHEAQYFRFLRDEDD